MGPSAPAALCELKRYANDTYLIDGLPVLCGGLEMDSLRRQPGLLIQPMTEPVHNLQHFNVSIGGELHLERHVTLYTELLRL